MLYVRFLYRVHKHEPKIWSQDKGKVWYKDWRSLAAALFVSCVGILVCSFPERIRHMLIINCFVPTCPGPFGIPYDRAFGGVPRAPHHDGVLLLLAGPPSSPRCASSIPPLLARPLHPQHPTPTRSRCGRARRIRRWPAGEARRGHAYRGRGWARVQSLVLRRLYPILRTLHAQLTTLHH